MILLLKPLNIRNADRSARRCSLFRFDVHCFPTSYLANVLILTCGVSATLSLGSVHCSTGSLLTEFGSKCGPEEVPSNAQKTCLISHPGSFTPRCIFCITGTCLRALSYALRVFYTSLESVAENSQKKSFVSHESWGSVVGHVHSHLPTSDLCT